MCLPQRPCKAICMPACSETPSPTLKQAPHRLLCTKSTSCASCAADTGGAGKARPAASAGASAAAARSPRRRPPGDSEPSLRMRSCWPGSPVLCELRGPRSVQVDRLPDSREVGCGAECARRLMAPAAGALREVHLVIFLVCVDAFQRGLEGPGCACAVPTCVSAQGCCISMRRYLHRPVRCGDASDTTHA